MAPVLILVGCTLAATPSTAATTRQKHHHQYTATLDPAQLPFGLCPSTQTGAAFVGFPAITTLVPVG
jgi:hypothetical protein